MSHYVTPDAESREPVAGARSAADTPGAGAAASADEPAALRNPPAHVCFWSVAALGLALDLWSKDWAFATLRQGGQRVLIPGLLELQTTLNSGALFGIAAGYTSLFVVASLLALALVVWMFAQCPARRRLLQVALGAILAGALGNMYDRVFVKLYGVRTPAGAVRYYARTDVPSDPGILLREYPLHTRGEVRTLPRTYERELGKPIGHVRDFIKIPTTLPRWDWIPAKWRGREAWPWVFNVADMLLVGGVGVLAIRMWRDHRRSRPSTDAADKDSPATA